MSFIGNLLLANVSTLVLVPETPAAGSCARCWMPQIDLLCLYGWDRTDALSMPLDRQITQLSRHTNLSLIETALLIAELGARATFQKNDEPSPAYSRTDLIQMVAEQMEVATAVCLEDVLTAAKGLRANEWTALSTQKATAGAGLTLPGSLYFAAFLAAFTIAAQANGGTNGYHLTLNVHNVLDSLHQNGLPARVSRSMQKTADLLAA
jgi:hypothetical protein